MRILILSAYHSISHAYWVKGLKTLLPEITFSLLSLKPKHFSYKIRGNPLEFYPQLKSLPSDSIDALLCTSMVDVATLRGLLPHLAAKKWLVYFHENQFAYPPSPHGHSSLEPAMVQWYGALASDALIFNSKFNQSSFLQGVAHLACKLPRESNFPDAEITTKGRVIPVPILGPRSPAKPLRAKPLSLLWNHRFDHDKAPDRLEKFLNLCQKVNLPVRIHITGSQHPKKRKEMMRLKHSYPQWVGEVGFLAGEAYQKLIRECDVVLSTALQDFQGISIAEACYQGLLPLVPDRLAYQEYIPKPFRYQSFKDDPSREAKELLAHLQNWLHSPPDLHPFHSWDPFSPKVIQGLYRRLFQKTIRGDEEARL